MQILSGNLVRLVSKDGLPIPWYQRAPMGLISGTSVHIALQQSDDRPVGDLLLSVINPQAWPWVSTLTCSRPDQPGVLAEAFDAVPPLNIGLAETVTVDSGMRHEARLIIEPFGLDPYAPRAENDAAFAAGMQKLKEQLKGAGFDDIHESRLPVSQKTILVQMSGTVTDGWVRGIPWEAKIVEHSQDSDLAQIDLDVAVVSADTRRRLVRFVFPRLGARTVRVEHIDQPGALASIAGALADQEMNILSLIIRRSSRIANRAEIVAVVEPQETVHADEMQARIRQAERALNKVKPGLEAVWVNTGSVHPDSMVYPRRSGDVLARPPQDLEPTIRVIRDRLAGRKGIFISRRFIRTTDTTDIKILDEVRRLIESVGLVPLEALPQAGTTAASSVEVKAHMWAAVAAVMLVVATGDGNEFSINLAHEAGFVQGQGKELFPLVQNGLTSAIVDHPNLQGMQLGVFDRELATDPTEKRSIAGQLQLWLDKLVQNL